MPDWLREGAAIVGSILLAFGIDARRELAEEQSEAAALLEVLRKDFTSTAAEAEAEAALAHRNVHTNRLFATRHVSADLGDLPWAPRPAQAWAHPESAVPSRPLATI